MQQNLPINIKQEQELMEVILKVSTIRVRVWLNLANGQMISLNSVLINIFSYEYDQD